MTATTKKILTAIIAIALIAVIVFLVLFLTQKNGFVREGDDVYCYENGDKVVGWKIVKDGEETTRYYFDADGKMHKGWLKLDDDYFYFRSGNMNNNDLGGQLLISQSACITLGGIKADGTVEEVVYWYFEFGENGEVTRAMLDEEKYKANGEIMPDDVVAPQYPS